MRGVAARLGVAVMSTYRYVPSKEDLVLHMADAAFGEASYPPDAPRTGAAASSWVPGPCGACTGSTRGWPTSTP
ncbi:hypothetical protein GCM10010222_45860 [Streptomyces tanashiensis]|uniref:TetR/AcrR family transcriptional regulator n=1 Tax=Streptomyces tanashiensis TaxID=67367 RepID=UPI00198E26F2|nr:TetR/AcrR family transcriptional regulator [Streptomyces tanashiensis]GGS98949.1 hypothetical protein GCM10010222_45860 [Streptomyces tanashiensis]